MNIVLNIKDINTENIYLLESKKNIIMDGSFTKLLYSNHFLSFHLLCWHRLKLEWKFQLQIMLL